MGFAQERTGGDRGLRPGPSAASPAAARPALIRLQRAVGNRAVSALVLARAPGRTLATGSAVRKVVLDANVFDEIARGNIEAANKLRELVTRDDVYISWQAFNEWVVTTTDRQGANTVRRIIDVLHIKAAPPAPQAVLNELRAKNSYKMGKNPATILSQDKDLRVAADAKALDGEVWSFDGAFANNSGAVEKTLGVKVAEESTTIGRVPVRPTPKAKQSRALRILGIKEDPVAGHLPEGSPAGGPGAAAKDIEGAAAKEGENVAAKEVEKVAAKEAEKLAGRTGGLWTRLAGKFDVELLEGLVPNPLDAIELLIDFFGSFAVAREAIRARNLRSGVAIGLAAYLVIPTWEWAKQFAHTAVSRDVITEILDAAGVAENAFNEGLVRGFLFGERHSKDQADRLRQKAFDTVLRQDRSVGRYAGDDEWSFDPDDVYTFASVLMPLADWFLAEAERMRNERLEREREREVVESYSRGPSPGEPKY